MITHYRTNEELQPICNTLSFAPENRVLSVAGGGCVPLVTASFGSDVVMVDIEEGQITHALKRIQDVTKGDLASILSVYDGTEKVDAPNITYLRERLKGGKLGTVSGKQRCVFAEWCENMARFDRVYLSNVIGIIPREIGDRWQHTPQGTLIYTSCLGTFEGSLAGPKLLEGFLKHFEKDTGRTAIAQARKVDTFWNPVVYKRK